MRKRSKRIDIFLYSKAIKKSLEMRFKQLNLNYSQIVRDARDNGNKTISTSNLSVYFNYAKPMAGGLTHSNLLWLCIRYEIEFKLFVKSPLIQYNEERAINNLKKYF